MAEICPHGTSILSTMSAPLGAPSVLGTPGPVQRPAQGGLLTFHPPRCPHTSLVGILLSDSVRVPASQTSGSFHSCCFCPLKLRYFQFSPVIQSCPTLWDPTGCSTPGFLVHHQLPEFAQTRAHQVGDNIEPSHPPSSPSPPAFNLSQHQGIFQ